MANPFLPLWEYIPDGEPRVFGDRIYLYGSHDRASCDMFCDYKLKIWSASVNDLNHWKCHGQSFCTREDKNHKSNTSEWTDSELYAPDVVQKDGKYYLYAYILGSKGCVGISENPEGPFELLGKYIYETEDGGDDGIFNDPGVLVDDDGKVYIYYGYEKSHFGKINPENMREILKGSYKKDIQPEGKNETDFFEASSIRKVGKKYYFIYSPRRGCRLDYAISESPEGPFIRKGTIIDNGIDYPGGNNHGSISCINGQWYVFYHKMTNGTITSRRACVEKIKILEDGTIPEVEMTSLGFEDSLNPYEIIPAEIACVLKGKNLMITQLSVMTRVITNIHSDCVIGYKYFDFGNDFTSGKMNFIAKVKGSGVNSRLKIMIDDYENGTEIGKLEIGTNDGEYSCEVQKVTGIHSLYFIAENPANGWFKENFDNRNMFDFISFVFVK